MHPVLRFSVGVKRLQQVDSLFPDPDRAASALHCVSEVPTVPQNTCQLHQPRPPSWHMLFEALLSEALQPGEDVTKGTSTPKLNTVH